MTVPIVTLSSVLSLHDVKIDDEIKIKAAENIAVIFFMFTIPLNKAPAVTAGFIMPLYVIIFLPGLKLYTRIMNLQQKSFLK